MPAADRLRRAVAAVWRLPGAVMVVVMALCLATREWYPLSPFPMYATFSPQSWYICVTDERDRLVPTLPAFGMEARFLHRMFETRVLERTAAGEPHDAAELHAADDLLRFVLRETGSPATAAPHPARLRLRRVTSSIADGRIERRHESLGEVARP